MLLGHKDLSWRQVRTHTRRVPSLPYPPLTGTDCLWKRLFHSKRRETHSYMGWHPLPLLPSSVYKQSPNSASNTFLSWPRFLVFTYQELSTQSLVPGTGHSSCPTLLGPSLPHLYVGMVSPRKPWQSEGGSKPPPASKGHLGAAFVQHTCPAGHISTSEPWLLLPSLL